MISLKLKALITGFFLFLGILVVPSFSSVLATTLKLDPDNTNVAEGKDLIVDIVLSGKDEQIDGVDALVSYDVNYLELKDIKNGSFFGNYPVKSDDNGEVRVTAFAPKEGVKVFDDVVVATLTFEILDSGDTKLDFVFEKGSTKDSNVAGHANGEDTLTEVKGGEYSVVASPENLQRAAARRPSGGISPVILFIIILILIGIALWWWWKNRKRTEEVYVPEPFPMDRPPDLG
jgi:hypothetical protein